MKGRRSSSRGSAASRNNSPRGVPAAAPSAAAAASSSSNNPAPSGRSRVPTPTVGGGGDAKGGGTGTTSSTTKKNTTSSGSSAEAIAAAAAAAAAAAPSTTTIATTRPKRVATTRRGSASGGGKNLGGTGESSSQQPKSASSSQQKQQQPGGSSSSNNKRVLTRKRRASSGGGSNSPPPPVATAPTTAAAATASTPTTAPTRGPLVPLTAVFDGALINVKIILAHQPYSPTSSSHSNSRSSSSEEQQGYNDYATAAAETTELQFAAVDTLDGNQYYCQVCGGFGDVVCCDGCPRVYHGNCVPANSVSRSSLDRDDDPWYCPECIGSGGSGDAFQQQQNESSNKSKRSNKASSRRGDNKSNNEIGGAGGAPSSSRKSSQNRCVDCYEDRPDLGLEPCKGCGTYVHTPSCVLPLSTTTSKTTTPSKKGGAYCANCMAIDRDGDDDDDDDGDGAQQQQQLEDGSSNNKYGYASGSAAAAANGDAAAKRKAKRKKSMSSTTTDGERRKKKKKKKRKRSLSTTGSLESGGLGGGDQDNDAGGAEGGGGSSHLHHEEDDDGYEQDRGPPVKAMPAFCFYLAENRWKIERALSKSHRTFNRMPKGDERNAVIAEEAADWWTKLTESEQKQYINMSMRDFEARVIAWKEEKAIRAMQMMGEDDDEYPEDDEPTTAMLLAAPPQMPPEAAEGDAAAAATAPDAAAAAAAAAATSEGGVASAAAVPAVATTKTATPADARRAPEAVLAEPQFLSTTATTTTVPSDTNRTDALLTYEKHERLFLNTSVGSKPFRPEPDQSFNRVLLDILHDMRFHPLPMFQVNRPDNVDQVIDEHNSKVTIPYFDVHGPIATGIGDECSGCARGWTHFCPVLQRRIPAIEHRARLQPPLSSLVSTRIGLGLRPRRPPPSELAAPPPHQQREGGLFQWRDSDETLKLKAAPAIPSASLTDPSERMDDMVQFIEETTAMKVPEPPRPTFPDKNWRKMNRNARALPLQRSVSVADAANSDGRVFNKCGRCRTLIETDTGCHQCRRAQLVINKSRKQPSENGKGGEDKSLLKVHTAVLGRIQARELNLENANEGDAQVSEAILKERWCPSAILPPQQVHVPTPKEPEEDDDDDFVSTVGSDAASESLDSSIQSSANNGKKKSSDDGRATPMESIPEDSNEETTEGVPDDSDGPPRPVKRARLARNVVAAREVSLREQKHYEIHKLYKKESSELQKKTVQVSCYSILLALTRRDPFRLFAEPVNAEGYAALVQRPIDFSMIREKLLAGNYTSLSTFVADVKLLCNNALAYNPPASLYSKTAKEMLDVVDTMQKRAFDWIGTIKDAHTNYLLHQDHKHHRKPVGRGGFSLEPFKELREKWPEAIQMLESEEVLRKRVESDFMRTQENEVAYYGALAVRRTAAAAESSLAPYPDSLGMHSAIALRTHYEDEDLREHVDSKVVKATQPIMLQNVSTWREESLVRLMRKVQKIRLERKTITENGCSRCDGVLMDEEWKTALNADATHPGKPRKKGDGDVPRVNHSRILLSTGLGSAKTCQKIVSRQPKDDNEDSGVDSIQDACVSVRGSRIHGMGLFADQPFSKGDVVAEYIGEYVVNAVAEEREKIYGEQRIQDYQFRLDDKLIIDATKKGGHGRYINHNCTPNCKAKIIPGDPPQEHLRRVIIVAQRSIDLDEEITYDYQFPLELDLNARIPCNCQSDACRGFMNWDLPEKGSNNRALLVQKRGANMRDRIRRLGRPLKRDEA